MATSKWQQGDLEERRGEPERISHRAAGGGCEGRAAWTRGFRWQAGAGERKLMTPAKYADDAATELAGEKDAGGETEAR